MERRDAIDLVRECAGAVRMSEVEALALLDHLAVRTGWAAAGRAVELLIERGWRPAVAGADNPLR